MTLPSTQHLQRLLALLQMLASEGIEMESHHYDSLAFGNFTLVLAKGHTKVRFLWDGKESILTVKYQKVQSKAATGVWQHDAFISVPSDEAVFAEIGSNAETMLL
jgi:hypothetical protein